MPAYTLFAPFTFTVLMMLFTRPGDLSQPLAAMFFIYCAIVGATTDILSAIKKGKA